jgi:hypothetical protein
MLEDLAAQGQIERAVPEGKPLGVSADTLAVEVTEGSGRAVGAYCSDCGGKVAQKPAIPTPNIQDGRDRGGQKRDGGADASAFLIGQGLWPI